MTDITQPDMVEGEDPFWRSWPSEHQLRDALAGVLHAQGWTVWREMTVGSGLRLDLVARRSAEIDLHVIELKHRIRTLLEAERALDQCARYVHALEAEIPEAHVAGYVTAGSFGAVREITLTQLTRHYEDWTRQPVQLCRPGVLEAKMTYVQNEQFSYARWCDESDNIKAGKDPR